MSSIGPCLVCKKPASFQCSACHTAPYCGKEHQKQDWPQHKTVCRSYKVKSSPEGLQYVVAARSIKKDSVIIEEIPLVMGPRFLVHVGDICPGCHRMGMWNQHCRKCSWPICNAQCSGLVDPTRHGAECAVLSKIKHRVIRPSSEIILPLRCLLLQKTDPTKWKVFLKMAARATELLTSSASNESMYVLQESILNPLVKIAPGLVSDCSEDTVRKVYAVLCVYGLELDIDGSLSGHVIAVFPVASLMEHSCLPNTQRHLIASSGARDRLVMRATQDISTGENITTLFMDTWMSTYLRQSSLWERRKVLCKCARCLDPRELGTDFGTLRCTESCCTGWVLATIKPEISPEILDWKCEKCGKIYPVDEIDELNRNLRLEIDACRAVSEGDIQKEEALLARLEKLLHPNHHYCMVVKGFISDHYGTMLFTQSEQMSDAVLEKIIEVCRDIETIRRDPAIVTPDWQNANNSLMLMMADAELARRKKVFENKTSCGDKSQDGA